MKLLFRRQFSLHSFTNIIKREANIQNKKLIKVTSSLSKHSEQINNKIENSGCNLTKTNEKYNHILICAKKKTHNYFQKNIIDMINSWENIRIEKYFIISLLKQ